jgi:hypothetical protein
MAPYNGGDFEYRPRFSSSVVCHRQAALIAHHRGDLQMLDRHSPEPSACGSSCSDLERYAALL